MKKLEKTVHFVAEGTQEGSRGVEHRVPWKAYDIDDVDTVLAKKDAEIRRTKRALYKALANWALSTLAWLDCIDQGNPAKWHEMYRKCLTEVEKYK